MKMLSTWWLEFRKRSRARAQSPLRRRLRWAKRVLLALGGLYLLCLCFPQPLFAHQLNDGRITLYSTEPIPEGAGRAALARAETLLSQSELFDPSARFRVFLCNRPGLFRFLSLNAGGAFGVSIMVGRNVFINQADVGRDLAFRKGLTNNERSLSGLIAHELTHQMIGRRIGVIGERLLPSWKAEGYCELIAQHGSFDEARGLELIRAGKSDPSWPFWYFKNRQLITYLMRQRGMSFEAIMKAKLDPEQTLRELAASLNAPPGAR